MNNEDFLKWCLEITNQEYKGDISLFMANLAIYNRLETEEVLK